MATSGYFILSYIILITLTEVKGQRFCADGYDISFSEDREDFDTARQNCNNSDSYLVKVDNTVIADAIRSRQQPERFLSKGRGYYVGAKSSEGNRYYWLDGTPVPNRSSPWHYWADGEPNRRSEECVIVGYYNWKFTDIACYGRFHFICQKAWPLTVSLQVTQVIISDASTYEIACSWSNAYSCVNIVWRNSKEVSLSSNKNKAIYQNQQENVSTLVIHNPNVSSSGIYKCLSSRRSQYGQPKQVNVIVHGQPNVTAIAYPSCKAAATISWIPGENANNSSHRVTVRSKLSQPFTFGMEPSVRRFDVTDFMRLNDTTVYDLEITTCKVNAKCQGNFQPTRITFISGGKPNSVQSVNTSLNGKACHVTWTPPTIIGDPIKGYRVTVIESLLEFRGIKSEQFESNQTVSVPIYSFEPLPNRNYSFLVAAVTSCNRASDQVLKGQTCVTKPRAPNIVDSPKSLSSTDSLNPSVTIPIPDEKHGLISCLLLLVTNRTVSPTSTTYDTVESFEQLISDKFSNSTYVAHVIGASRFVGRRVVSVTIGDSSTSSCNLFDTNATSNEANDECRTDSNKTICVKNRPLTRNSVNNLHVIAVVPVDGKLSIQRSMAMTLDTAIVPKDISTSESSTIPAVAGALGGLLLITLIIGLALITRRRRKSAESDAKPIVDARNTTPPVTVTVANGNPAYENTAFHELQHRNISAHDMISNGQTVSATDDTYVYMAIEENRCDDKSPTRIYLDTLENIYSSKRKNDNSGFKEEFQMIEQICKEKKIPAEFASNTSLKQLNRYKNVLPFDSSRVAIRGNESGYINACFIDGYRKKKMYIATQGPLSRTIEDFWRMVLEQRASTIVMLARTVEKGKKKCERYWPTSGQQSNYGAMSVENSEEQAMAGFVRRNLIISDGKTTSTVAQFQFFLWPDHGVPQITTNLVQMQKAVKDYHTTHGEGPMIVHCSAGAGRTGTYIGYDMLLEEASATRSINVYECVLKMRSQRVEMVQNSNQYTLIHKLMLESYLFGNTDLSTEEFTQKYGDLNRKSTSTVLAKQLSGLRRVPPMMESKTIAKSYSSKDEKLIPYDYSLVTTPTNFSMDASPYPNACWIQTFDEAHGLIAACTPNESTASSFWSMAIGNGIDTIVALNENSQTKDQRHYPMLRDQVRSFEGLTLKAISVDEKDKFVIRKFASKSGGINGNLTMLQLTSWNKESFPPAQDLIELVQLMKETVRNSEKRNILVHCKDGIVRTGVFCAVMNLLDRIQLEGRVDLFRTTKDIRDAGPEYLSSQELYMYCCEVVNHYLRSNDIYSNFNA